MKDSEQVSVQEEVENIEFLLAALTVRVASLKSSLNLTDPNTTTTASAHATGGGVARRIRSAARLVSGKRYTVTDFLQDYKLNDRVVVTNKYKGLQGTEGHIHKLDFPWVHLTTDSGATIYRKYSNVSVISHRK